MNLAPEASRRVYRYRSRARVVAARLATAASLPAAPFGEGLTCRRIVLLREALRVGMRITCDQPDELLQRLARARADRQLERVSYAAK